MADLPLAEPFDIVGEWHLPSNPDHVVAGTLYYTPEHTELHLLGVFEPLQEGTVRFDNEDWRSYPVIHGTTRNGEAMTLLKAQRAGLSLNFGPGGMNTPERLLSTWLLVGAHIPFEFEYPEMRFRIPGLQVWMSRPVIQQSCERDEATGSMTLSYNVRWMTKETSRVPSIDANIDWGYGWRQSNSDVFTTIDVTVEGWIVIRPDMPHPIEWYFKQLSKITTMLAFLAGTPMSSDCIQAGIGRPGYDVSVMVALRDAKYCLYKHPREFFISRKTMGVDLHDVISHWIEIYPRVHMPSQLALSVLASEKLWQHVEFLSLMQALEGFHRGLFAGNYMEEGDYEPVKKALGDAIPTEVMPDHKAALKSRIRYGNQVSLRKRLDELVKIFPEQTRQIILGGDGKVPSQWIDTRNYYTHWDEELRANVLDGQGMYDANVRMHHLLRVLYLNLMNIPQEAILNSLNSLCGSAQHLAQINARERG